MNNFLQTIVGEGSWLAGDDISRLLRSHVKHSADDGLEIYNVIYSMAG